MLLPHGFTRQVFPRWVAFVVGWVMIAAAMVSLSFARYVSYFLPVGGRVGPLLAVGLVVGPLL